MKVEVTFDPLSIDMQPVGPGLAIQRGLRVRVWDVQGYDATLSVAVEKGRLIAEEVCIQQREGGPSVTVEGIRLLPIAHLLRLVAAEYLQEVEQTHDTEWTFTTRSLTPELLKEMVVEGPTERTLKTVAYLYRWANAVGEPPVKMVEKTMELSRSKTGRWISLARKRGFLGPAEGPGRSSV